MSKRGLTTIVLASDKFAGLVRMQAKARKVEPRLAIFTHPLGGIGPDELGKRIDEAWESLLEEIEKG